METGLGVSVEVADPIGLALHFAGKNSVTKFINNLPQLLEKRHRLTAVVRKDSFQTLRRWCVITRVRIGRIIAEQFVLCENRACIHPETINTAVHPEAEHVLHGPPNVWIVPIKVGLLEEKRVVVVLPAVLIPLPCATPKAA
jgi:hypothetical protein